MKSNLDKKNFLWNAIGSSFNAFISLILLISVNRINGANAGGIFTYCFSLACLLYFVVNYFGRTFQVTDIKNEFNDKEYIVNRLFSFIFMLIILLIIIYVSDFDSKKSNMLISLSIYRGIDGFSEVFYGILHKNNNLYKAGVSMTLKALILTLAFIIIDFFTSNIIIACWSLVLINLIIMILYDLFQSIKFINKEEKINFVSVFKIYKVTFFVFGLSFLAVYLTNLTKYNMNVESNEIQNIYGILLMPSTFVSLCGTYLINPFLGELGNSLKINDIIKFKTVIKNLIKYITSIGIVIVIGTTIFGPFILKILYGINFNDYRWHLVSIMLGAIFYTIGQIYSNALTTIRKTSVQFVIYLIASIFGFVTSFILIDRYSILGATISYVIIMFVQLVLYIIYFSTIIRRKQNEKKS